MSEKPKKKIKLIERIPDLWYPFCGEQVHKNGIWDEDTHTIEHGQNHISIICGNNSVMAYITVEIKAGYHSIAKL